MKNRKGQAKAMIHGGMVSGKGGPTEDKNLRFLPEGASVLPADTTRAVGGPTAVNALIGATHQPATANGAAHLRALSTKESVLPPDTTQAIGGAPAVKELIDATHTPVPEPKGGRVPLAQLAMAGGGYVGYGYADMDQMIEDQRKRLESQRLDDEMKQIEERRASVEDLRQRRMTNSNALSAAYRADGEPYVRSLAARAKGARNGDYVGSVGTSWNDEFDARQTSPGAPRGRPAVWTAIGAHPNPTLKPITGFGQPSASWVMNSQSPGKFPRDFARESPPVLSKEEEDWLRGLSVKAAEAYYRLPEDQRKAYRMSSGVAMANGGTVGLAQRVKGMANGGTAKKDEGGSMTYSIAGRRDNLFRQPADYASYEDYQQSLWDSLTPEQRIVAQHNQQTAQKVDAITAERNAANTARADALLASGRFSGMTPRDQQWARENAQWIEANTAAPTPPEALAQNNADLQARDASVGASNSMEAAQLADRLQGFAQSGAGNAVYAEQMKQAQDQYQKLTGKQFVPTQGGNGFDLRSPDVIAVEQGNMNRVRQNNAQSSAAKAAVDARIRAGMTPEQLQYEQSRGRYLDPVTPPSVPLASRRPAAPPLPSATAPVAARPNAPVAATRPTPAGAQAPQASPQSRQGPMSLAGRALERMRRPKQFGMASGGTVLPEPMPGESEEEYLARIRDAQRIADAPKPLDYGALFAPTAPSSLASKATGWDRVDGDKWGDASIGAPAAANVAPISPPTTADYGPKDDFAFRNLIRAGAEPGAPQGAQPELAGMTATKQYEPGGTVITAQADKGGRFNSFSGTGNPNSGINAAADAAYAKIKDEYAASFNPRSARPLADMAIAANQRQARELSAQTAPLVMEDLRQKVEAGAITLEAAKKQAALLRTATDDNLDEKAKAAALKRYRELYIVKTGGKGQLKVVGGGQDDTGRTLPQHAVWVDEDGNERWLQPSQGGADKQPLPNHIEALKKDPKLAKRFDEQYGAGAAKRYLGQ